MNDSESNVVPQTRRRSRWRFILKRIIIFPTTIYIALLAIMMYYENSLIYPAPKFPAGYWQSVPENCEDATFQAADGTDLHGWFIDHESPRGTLLYFHGNAENVSLLGPLLETLNQRFGLRVLAFDYRGYGKSGGSPNEPGIYLDAQAALNWLNRRTNTQPADVILFGRSIGGAVAVQLAATNACKALVLENTFTSLPDAAAVHFPWLPVRWIMRNRFPSITRIQNCQQPLLQAHGSADEIIPIAIGRRLFEASPSLNKRFLEFPGLSHNDQTPEKFWLAFEALLAGQAN